MFLSRVRTVLQGQQRAGHLFKRTYANYNSSVLLQCPRVNTSCVKMPKMERNCRLATSYSHHQYRLISLAAVRLQASQELDKTVSPPEDVVNSSAPESKELILDFIPEKPVPLDATTVLGKLKFFILIFHYDTSC